jgi:hypothetical protein
LVHQTQISVEGSPQMLHVKVIAGAVMAAASGAPAG